MQKILEESRNHYADLYDFSPLGCVTLDSTGCIRDINLTGATLLGRTQLELIDTAFSSFMDKSTVSIFNNHLQRCKNSGDEAVTEMALNVKDGKSVDVHLLSLPIYDAKQKTILYRTVIIDITKRKQAELVLNRLIESLKQQVTKCTTEQRKVNEELQTAIAECMRMEEQVRKLSLAVEQSPVTVIITDAEGNIEYVNPYFTELTGYTSEEVIGQNPRILKSGETPPEEYKRLWETITSGGTWRGEFHNKKKNGELYWESASISPITNPEGVITHFVAVKEDITGRKRSEEKLRILRELDKNIIAHTRDYDEVFETATHLVNKVMPCDRVTLVMVDEEKNGFIYCYGWGTKVRKKGDFVPFEMTDATTVVMKKSTILRNDLRKEKELASLDKEFMEEGFLSDIRILLIIRGRVAGLLNIGSRKAGTFTSENVATAEMIAGQLLIALENSLLFKRLGESLEEVEKSNKQIITILGSITDGFLALDRKWRFTYINPEAERHLFRKREELLGKNIWDEFPETVDTAFFREYHRAMLEQVTVEFEEFYPPLKKWYEARVYPSQEGLSVYFRDITERKQMEEERKHSLEKLQKALGGTIQALALTVEMRDPYTAGHQQRVANLAHSIATDMALGAEQTEGIRMAGAVHDIGKIAVPAEILSKPGKIAETEFNIIKTHPQVGYDILRGIEFPWPVAEIVLQHQERIDGSGYPAGLSDGQIMLEAKILAVADVVEAMSSHRPYRPALNVDKALAEISNNKGVLYDARVVDICVRLFRERGFKFDNVFA